MIHEILHIIGLCGDSFTHMDLIDILINLQQTNNINITNFKTIYRKNILWFLMKK